MRCFGIILGLMVTAGLSGVSAAEKPDAKAKWKVEMRGLEGALQELIVDVSSDDRFNNKANFKRIESNAQKVSKLAEHINEMAESPEADPSVKVIAGVFTHEAKHAYQTLKWGHRTYARDVLRSLTGYCIACHTRNASGPAFAGLPPDSKIKALPASDRANVLAAIRQFGEAYKVYLGLVDDKKLAATDAFEWERAVRSALAIAVRVEKDPAKAEAVVKAVQANAQAPFFMREQAKSWGKSIEAWKAEGKVSTSSEEGLYAEALRLIARAKSEQQFTRDRSADIDYLRAGSVVHDLLLTHPKGKRVNEALYLAGICQEVLADLSLWEFGDFYFVACIQNAPHTEMAAKCYRKYEESVYLGYTGSAGTSVPDDVRRNLKVLEAMAGPSGGAVKAAP